MTTASTTEAAVAVRERPLLCSGPMVRAMLAGTKSVTRRVVKPQPDKVHDGEPYWYVGGYRVWRYRGITDVLRMGTSNPLDCPYGEPGVQLWVREAWHCPKQIGGSYHREKLHWRENFELHGFANPPKWRPSIYMPRWASRITLEITEVRVERVQEISEDNAFAEGIVTGKPYTFGEGRECFAALWNSLNASRGFGWDANPWVWAITFRDEQRERLS